MDASREWPAGSAGSAGPAGSAPGISQGAPSPAGLTTSRGAALYIGALLGPGLLLLPGLAPAEISLYGAGLASPAALVALPTALFLLVYLGCMTSAARILRGPARWAAAPAALFVAVVLAYCGWSLPAPAAVILAVFLTGPLARTARARLAH